MMKLALTLIGPMLLCLGAPTECAGMGSSPEELNERTLAEQKHFVECLAWVYNPALWISYNDALYFQPRNETQVRQLEAMKAARLKYVALTNRVTRHELAAKLIAASGIGGSWQKRILLPLSDTNPNLTPTLDRPVRVIPNYKVLRSLADGDALIQDGEATCFVMNFGRGADDGSGTNAVLIKEGVKSYSVDRGFKTVDACVNVSLSAEERAVLNRVADAFQREAARLGQNAGSLKATQDFEDCRARATDSNPYIEYLLAKCYLEGKGTDKDEKLGLEWMNKAARSGSGDARAYLEKMGNKTPSP
jgi:hypothetical protein